jgi:hypothetical protein
MIIIDRSAALVDLTITIRLQGFPPRQAVKAYPSGGGRLDAARAITG